MAFFGGQAKKSREKVAHNPLRFENNVFLCNINIINLRKWV